MNFRLLKYGSTSWIIDHRNNILAVKIYSVLLDQCWENQILYFLFCSTPRCIFQKCTVARCRLVWCGLHSCSGALSPRQLFLHSCSGALWPRQLFLFKTKLIIWGRVAVSKSLKILAMPRRGGVGVLTIVLLIPDGQCWRTRPHEPTLDNNSIHVTIFHIVCVILWLTCFVATYAYFF